MIDHTLKKKANFVQVCPVPHSKLFALIITKQEFKAVKYSISECCCSDDQW